ncbi:MAG: FtsW/RodA/SpoVE family cell cycle protein, partial [Gammaproteobacteria bacterium]
MTISMNIAGALPALKRMTEDQLDKVDSVLLVTSLALLAIGLVMVTSASISVADRNLSSPFYYLQRQAIFIVIGVIAAWFVYQIRLVQWEKSGMALLG